MPSVDKRSDKTLVNASVVDANSDRMSSISNCTTLLNGTHEPHSSPSRPIERRVASANNPSYIRPDFSLPSHRLLNLQNAAEEQYAQDKETPDSVKRFLSEKDRTSNSFKATNQRDIRGHTVQNHDANEHPNDQTSFSPARPISLYRNSPLMRHLDNGTWQVGLRSPDKLGRDGR